MLLVYKILLINYYYYYLLFSFIVDEGLAVLDWYATVGWCV